MPDYTPDELRILQAAFDVVSKGDDPGYVYTLDDIDRLEDALDVLARYYPEQVLARDLKRYLRLATITGRLNN